MGLGLLFFYFNLLHFLSNQTERYRYGGGKRCFLNFKLCIIWFQKLSVLLCNYPVAMFVKKENEKTGFCNLMFEVFLLFLRDPWCKH